MLEIRWCARVSGLRSLVWNFEGLREGVLSRLREVIARDRFDPSPAARKGNAEGLYLRGRALARMGDKQSSLEMFHDAAELNPKFFDAIEAHGETLDAMGQVAAAQAEYARARNVRRMVRGGAPDRHFVLRQKGPMTAEISAYTGVIKSLRKHMLPYLARGNAYLVDGQPDLALADYEHILRSRPRAWDVLAMKAEALSALERHSEALDVFNRVLEARPRDPSALNGRGIVRMALGQTEEANADWRKQLDLIRGRSAERAYLALRLADYEAAIPILEEAVAADSLDPYWRVYLRSCLIRLNRPMPASDGTRDGSWPSALMALQNGSLSGEEILVRADTRGRRTEALFQLAILNVHRAPVDARRYWQQVVDQGVPYLVEYAAARNELGRAAP